MRYRRARCSPVRLLINPLALTAPKAPLCKGSCHANSVTEGLLQYNVRISPKANADTILFTAQSLRVALRRPTSLYTREALVQCKLVNSYSKIDFFDTLTGERDALLFFAAGA